MLKIYFHLHAHAERSGSILGAACLFRPQRGAAEIAFRAELEFYIFTGMQVSVSARAAFFPEGGIVAGDIGGAVVRMPARTFFSEFAVYRGLFSQYALLGFRRTHFVQLADLCGGEATAWNGSILLQITSGRRGRREGGLSERGTYGFPPAGVLETSVRHLKVPAGSGRIFRWKFMCFLLCGGGSGIPWRKRRKKPHAAGQHADRERKRQLGA